MAEQKQDRSYQHNWGWIATQTNSSASSSDGYRRSDGHGAGYLSDTPELYEIQRRNNFELHIIFNNSAGNGKSDYAVTGDQVSLRRWDTDTGSPISKDNYIRDAAHKLRLSVSSCTIPNFSQDVIKIRRGNTEMKFAGVPTWGDGSIVCNDYIGAATYDILASWQAMAYNQLTERVGLVQDYKRSAWLIEYTPDYQEVRRWYIAGMWISSLSSDSFDYESNSKMTVSVTFQYDYATLQPAQGVSGRIS